MAPRRVSDPLLQSRWVLEIRTEERPPDSTIDRGSGLKSPRDVSLNDWINELNYSVPKKRSNILTWRKRIGEVPTYLCTSNGRAARVAWASRRHTPASSWCGRPNRRTAACWERSRWALRCSRGLAGESAPPPKRSHAGVVLLLSLRNSRQCFHRRFTLHIM